MERKSYYRLTIRIHDHNPIELDFRCPPSRADFESVSAVIPWLAHNLEVTNLGQLIAKTDWPYITTSHKAAFSTIRDGDVAVGEIDVRRHDVYSNYHTFVPDGFWCVDKAVRGLKGDAKAAAVQFLRYDRGLMVRERLVAEIQYGDPDEKIVAVMKKILREHGFIKSKPKAPRAPAAQER